MFSFIKSINKKLDKHFLLKYLLPYCIVPLIPLLSITLFTTNYVFDILNQTLVSNNQRYLGYATQTVHSSLLPLVSEEQKQYLDRLLFDWNLQTNTSNALSTQKVLDSIVRNNNLLIDIIYQNNEINYALTSRSTAQNSEVFNTMYRFGDLNIETFLNMPDGFSSGRVDLQYFDSKPENAMLYKTTLSDTENVILIIDTDAVLALMDDPDIDNDIAYVLDKDGKLLFGSDEALLAQYNVAQLFPSQDNSEIKTFGDTEYLKSSLYSNELEWFFVKLNPTAQTLSIVEELRINMVLVFIPTLLLCAFISSFFALRSYTPVKKLQERINKIMPDSIDSENNFEYIGDALQNLNLKKQQLEASLEKSNSDSKRTFLLRNFYGYFSDESTAKANAHMLSLNFESAFYTVAYIGDIKNRADIDTTNEILNQLCFPNMELHICNIREKNHVLVAVGLNEDKNMITEAYFSTITKQLKDKNIKGFTIGIGEAVNTLSKWNTSLEQAESAYSYYTLLGRNRYITYNEVKVDQNQKRIDVPEQALTNAMINADSDMFKHLLDEFQADVELKKPKQDKIKIYNYLLLRSLTNAIKELNKTVFINEPIPTEYLSDLKTDTMLDMIQVFSTMANELMEDVKLKRHNNTFAEICATLEANLSNCEFSATELAEEFNFSPSALSKYFKQRSGQSVTDYLTALRIEKAKELLITTNLNVSEICGQVGYANINSFCRRFKQITTTTPLNFKAENKL